MHLVVLSLFYASHGVFFTFLSILFHFLFFYIPPSARRIWFCFRTRREGDNFCFALNMMKYENGPFGCKRDVYSRRKHTCSPQQIIRYPCSEMIISREPKLDSCKFPAISSLAEKVYRRPFMLCKHSFHMLVVVHAEKQATNGKSEVPPFFESGCAIACSLRS
jgi:hypothetical protein